MIIISLYSEIAKRKSYQKETWIIICEGRETEMENIWVNTLLHSLK